jgi:hypothetical protein
MAADELAAYLQYRDRKRRIWPRSPLLPDLETFPLAALYGVDDRMKGKHCSAAFVEAMPHWIAYLLDRGLVTSMDTDGLWAALRRACSSLPDELDGWMWYDPTMLASVRAALAPTG